LLTAFGSREHSRPKGSAIGNQIKAAMMPSTLSGNLVRHFP
jgi:hypothetical protein